MLPAMLSLAFLIRGIRVKSALIGGNLWWIPLREYRFAADS